MTEEDEAFNEIERRSKVKQGNMGGAMTQDEELIDYVEATAFLEMFEGCLMDDHLEQQTDAGSWVVCIGVTTLCRLIDIARANKQ